MSLDSDLKVANQNQDTEFCVNIQKTDQHPIYLNLGMKLKLRIPRD